MCCFIAHEHYLKLYIKLYAIKYECYGITTEKQTIHVVGLLFMDINLPIMDKTVKKQFLQYAMTVTEIYALN